MNLTTLKYLFKEGIVGLWKNRTMALASSGTIILCLLILGMSYSIGTNIDSILKQVENRFGITSYIQEDLTEERLKEIQTEIESMSGISEIHYITKEEALRKFSEGMGSSAVVDSETAYESSENAQESKAVNSEGSDLKEENLESTNEKINFFDEFVGDNPLPASFEILVTDIEAQQNIVARLQMIPELETVYLKTETNMFIRLNEIINYVCLGIIACLVVVGVLLMSNTIRLTIYVRRKEINIMKYIGATDWFIRLPFLIEGTLIGIIGALVSVMIMASSYEWLHTKLSFSLMNVLREISFVPTHEIMRVMLPMCLLLGGFIGLVGSGLSLRKHLQV